MTTPSASALAILMVLAAGCAAPIDDGGAPEEGVASNTTALSVGGAVVTTTALNLRAAPNTRAAVLTLMPCASYLRPDAPVFSGSLSEAVAQLASESSVRSPGTDVGIAVRNLSTGEYVGANDTSRYVSASAAKVIWVAAAMRAGADVSDIADPIFRNSDNYQAGIAIDRAGGIDAVNDFYWDVAEMPHSIVANWSFGQTRVASNQGWLQGDNYFTPVDVISFLTKLDSGALVGERTGELKTYLTWSPRSGYAGWLGTLLPSAARASMMHKSGWLPTPDYPSYGTLNEVGIIQVQGGPQYAVAILARHGTSYALEQSFVERASCVIYRAIAEDGSIGCRD